MVFSSSPSKESACESGKVRIPSEHFFTMSKAEYSSWEHALAREFYQNSIDAKAKIINVEFDHEGRTISILDNGHGMDKDTILNRLLVLGGSKKEEGSTGCFGKAKELLYFSWPTYVIRTQNWRVEGSSADYTLYQENHYFTGTESKIQLHPSVNTLNLKHAFEHVAQLTQTPTRFTRSKKEKTLLHSSD